MTMKRMERLITASLLFSLSSFATASSAFEKRYYGMDDKQMKDIASTMKSADRVLDCEGIDRIDVDEGKLYNASGARQYFSRAHLKAFFEKEKQKTKLLVWINSYSPEGSKRIADELRRFLEPFGYKRILMLGTHCCGVFVLDDIQSTNSKSSEDSAITSRMDSCPTLEHTNPAH